MKSVCLKLMLSHECLNAVLRFFVICVFEVRLLSEALKLSSATFLCNEKWCGKECRIQQEQCHVCLRVSIIREESDIGFHNE